MITTLIASVLINTSPATINAQQSGAQIVSNCLARYYGRANLGGVISSKFEVGGKKINVVTKLQLSNPNLIYLEQKTSESQQVFRLVSDGDQFAYPVATNWGDKQEYRPVQEPIEQRDGTFLTVEALYGVVADRLPDRSIPLDIVMNRERDLIAIQSFLSNFQYYGERELNGEMVDIVSCKVRRTPTTAYNLEGAFYISKKGDLRKFETAEKTVENNREVIFRMSWEVNVWVNEKGKLDQNLFNLKRMLDK
ncbi:MAG: hypothetical protein KF824_02945 [Fimbriimonadaceae bacterium]|nr:MAG: hypothetical protein KF824_02945 [Fimbriimonadaceae bacterium]